MKPTLFIFLFTITTFTANAQQATSKEDSSVKALNNRMSSVTDTSKIYAAVQKEPEFPGGMEKFYRYVRKNMKYPDVARKNSIQGRVFITLVVEKDGSLSNINVVRGVSPELDEEAVRLFKSSPKWNPGIQNGYTVRAQYTVPISFQL